MEIVYKYCGRYGLDILRNLELKITPPNQFNDPFEFTPRFVCADTAQFTRELGEDEKTLTEAYEQMRTAGTFVGSRADFQKWVDQERAEIKEWAGDNMSQGLSSAERRQQDRASEEYGVLCLSGRRDSILMWGHYADQGRGLVIGFDRSCAVFKKEKGLRPVDYGRKRPVLDANWKQGSPEIEDYEDQLVLKKNDEWRYEQEFRQIFNLALLTKRPVNGTTCPTCGGLRTHRVDPLTKKPLKNGTPDYFLSIPSSAVVSVTLGPRCSRQLEGKVRTVLQSRELSNVHLDRADLSETDFSLIFRRVP